MPQVPDLVPNVVPTTQGAPEVNLPVPVDAFGGAVGHALQSMGSDISRAGNEVWQQAVNMQNLQNETQAKEADAKYMMQSGLMHAEFINREGLNAGPEALAKHIQDLQDLRVNIRAGLNPAAARMYDGSSLSFMGRNIFNAAGHSGQQMKVASNNAATSRKEITKNSIEANPGDDVAFQRGSQVIKSENQRLAANQGWTPEQLEATNENDISDYWSKRINGLKKNDAPGAQRMLDTAIKNKAIVGDHIDKVQSSVTTEMRLQGPRIISDTILGDRRSGEEENLPEQTYVDRAMKMVDTDPRFKDIQAKDPLFKDFVRDRILQQYNRQRAVETDQDNMNVRTIGGAMMKANQEGIRPSTVEELMTLDPAVGPAWDAISRNPALQQRFMKTLEHNATQPHIPVTPENLKAYHIAVGQAQGGNQEQAAEFLAHDWANEQNLTYTQRSQLMNLQDRMQKSALNNADLDPRVGRALGFLQQDLLNAGISKKNPDDYFQFRGALQSELMQFQQDNHRAPKPEEVIEMGKNLIRSQSIAGAGWFGMSSNMPVYQIPITDADKAGVIADITKKEGVPPSDARVERIIRNAHYKQFYSKPKSTSP